MVKPAEIVCFLFSLTMYPCIVDRISIIKKVYHIKEYLTTFIRKDYYKDYYKEWTMSRNGKGMGVKSALSF